MGSRDTGSRIVVVPDDRRAPEVIHFTARMEEPESPRDGESSAGSSSGGSGDPNGNKEENNGSGAMRILRAVGVAAIAVAVGGAVVLGGVLFSSDEAKKMMIAPGTNRLLKIARKDFENNPSGYFRALRALRNKK